jgi:multidrug resistance efflux pump
VARSVRLGILIGLIAAVALGARLVLRHSERYPATDDAYVQANVVGMVARVSGPIVELPITDNQWVRAGDLLFAVDPRPYHVAVDKARANLDETGQDVSGLADVVTSAAAQLAQADAQLRLAVAQYDRIQPLVKIGAIPYQDKDKADAGLAKAESQVDDARARLAKARHELGEVDAGNPEMRAAVADLESAELELSWTRVVAPVNGWVTDLALSLGSYANVGSPLLSLINSDSWRVEAYYKETQLEHIRPGQQARVYLPAYPDVRFEGRVQGIGWGVEQQNSDGAQGSDGVPTVSPTVDWVRMAQRFPVRITLLAAEADHPYRKAMRASVRIDTTAEVPAREHSPDAPGR